MYENNEEDRYQMTEAELNAYRGAEYVAIIVINVIFAAFSYFLFHSVDEVSAIKIYENVYAAAIGWFLYGGCLCLALRCERIEEQKWARPILKAVVFGILSSAVKMGLDHVTDWIIIENWSLIKTFFVSGAVNGVFAFLMMAILFAVSVKGKVNWTLQAAKPIAGMAVVAMFYIWKKNPDVWTYESYLSRKISMNVWTFAFFMIFLWWLLNILHSEKESVDRKVNRWINAGLILGHAVLLVFLATRIHGQAIHLPAYLTYPYEAVIKGNRAFLQAYLSEEKEVELPERIWWAEVQVIDGEIFSDLGTNLIVREVPEGVRVNRLYHQESQGYFTIEYGSEVSMDQYAGNEEKVEIPKEVWGRQVTRISDGCFRESSVKEVIIPETVDAIYSAFEGCKSLKQVTLPPQIELISQFAFKDSGIERIVLPKSVKSIGTGAFQYSEIREVVGLEDVEYIGNSAFRGTPLEESIEGEFVCFGDVLHLYRGDEEEVVIPSNVKKIQGAFALEEEYPYPRNVKKVFVPESVTEISGYSFEGQKGVEVYIPETVTFSEEKYPASIFGYEHRGLLDYNKSGNIIITTEGSPAVAHAIEAEEGRFRIITKEEMQREKEEAISGRDREPEEEPLNPAGVKWVDEYIDLLSGDGFSFDGYALIYIDENQIPELVGNNAYAYYQVCSCSGGGEAECYSKMPYATLDREFYYWPYKNSIICTYMEEDGTGYCQMAYGMTEETSYTELNENYISFYDIDFCSKEAMLDQLFQLYQRNAGRPYGQNKSKAEGAKKEPSVDAEKENVEKRKWVHLEEVEGYEYLRQLDLASADGNVYPVMVPKDHAIEEGDRFVIYSGNGFRLSMYARELFDGETLTDFLDSTSKFIYLEPEREYINVKDSGMTEKDGLMYRICTADKESSDGIIYPNIQLIAAIPLGGTDMLSFQLTFDRYSCNSESIKFYEEIEKYYQVPVAEFIRLLEE